MRPFINKLGLFFILLDNFLKIELKSIDFRAQYILYFLFIVWYFLTNRTLVFKKRYLYNIVIIVSIFTAVAFFQGIGFTLYIKQFLLIGFNLLFAYVLVNAYKFDFESLFKDYIQLIFIAAIVGLVQMISLLVGFKYGADYTYLGFAMGNFEMDYTRIQSWFEEPAAMAIAFLPVVFVCVARFFKLTEMISFRKAVFITFVFLLSQSSVGLLGLLLSLIVVTISKYSIFKRPAAILCSFILFALIGFGFYSIPLVKLRVDDTFKLFFDDTISGDDIDRTNLSTYAMFSNYRVSVAALGDKPFFGSGIGTHELNYDAYIHQVVPPSTFREEWQLNKKDANSLLLRIISEAGLFGLLLLAWFLYANKVKLNVKKQTNIEITHWVLNNSVFILILIRLLRQGHYTMLGFMLFVLIYFYSKRKIEKIAV